MTEGPSSVMGDRDYMAEMRAKVDAACVGTWSAPAVATQVVEDLRVNDPDLLYGFLDLCAVTMVRQLINGRDQSARSHNRKTASRSVFKEAAEEHERGNSAPLEELTQFLQELYVIEDGSKMALKDMHSTELNYVADTFEQRARENQMRAAFLYALANKCGDRAVGEIFTEEQVAALWLSIV